MPFVIRTKPNFLPLINGVAFAAHAEGSISVEISDEQAEAFLAHEGYRLADEDEAPAAVNPPVRETAAQRKAREKAEREAAAKAAAEQEAADNAAAEEAEQADAGEGEKADEEVF